MEQFFAFLALLLGLVKNNRYLQGAIATIAIMVGVKLYGHLLLPRSSKPPIVVSPKCRLKWQGRPNTSWRYVMVEADTPAALISPETCSSFRLQLLTQLLAQADSRLKTLGCPAYGNKIAPYFTNTDEISEKTSSLLLSDDVVFIDETIDSVSGRYTMTVNLAQAIGSDIDSFITAGTRRPCIIKALKKLFALKSGQSDTVSMHEIVTEICSSCSSVFKLDVLFAKE